MSVCVCGCHRVWMSFTGFQDDQTMNVHLTGQPTTLGQNPLCTEIIIDERQQCVYQLGFQTRTTWWFGSNKTDQFWCYKTTSTSWRWGLSYFPKRLKTFTSWRGWQPKQNFIESCHSNNFKTLSYDKVWRGRKTTVITLIDVIRLQGGQSQNKWLWSVIS